jgi:transcriptional regulator with XRE-family HTH domain
MQAQSADNIIGGRLRRLLRMRGQSIREFSEIAGIPYRTLQDYLAGKAKPGAEQLARVAAAGLDVNFLLTGKTLKSAEFSVSFWRLVRFVHSRRATVR